MFKYFKVAFVSFALLLFQVSFASNVRFLQTKTFEKLCEGARIALTPFKQVKLIENEGICALICMENGACNSFGYNDAMNGQCHLYHVKFKEMQIVLVKNWLIFAIQSKTISLE